MKRLLVYDLDGTLIDTREDIARSVNFTLRSVGRPELAPEEIFQCVGKGLHDLIRRVLRSEVRKEIEEAARIYRQYYEAHMLDHSRLYPGALDFLRAFRSRTQVLVTNKPNPFAGEMLKALGVADYFFKIVAGDQGVPRKPDPASVLSILAGERIPGSDAVMIGDSLIDLEMGRRAGMECVLLSHGFTDAETLRAANPDGLVQNFLELHRFAEAQHW